MSPPEKTYDSIDDAKLHIDFRGLPGESVKRGADIYCPSVRRWPFVNKNDVNRLDVVSCWKGLSYMQAAEVSMWEHQLRDALCEQLKEAVRATFSKDATESSSNDHSFLQVDLWRLVHDMITAAYSKLPHLSRGPSWFISTRDLPGMVYNFVRTHDCFQDPQVNENNLFSLRDSQANVKVEINHTCVGDEFHAVVVILWERPHVLLSDFHLAGDSFKIVPRTIPASRATSGFFPFPEETDYEMKSPTLQFSWDPTERCFSAVVPERKKSLEDCRKQILGHPKPTVVEATLTAKTTVVFPGNVRHERTSRYNIRTSTPDINMHVGTEGCSGLDYATAIHTLGLDPLDHVSLDVSKNYKRKDTEVQWTLHPMKDAIPIERKREPDHLGALSFSTPPCFGKASHGLRPATSSDWVEVKRSNAKPVSIVPLKRVRPHEANDPGSTIMPDLRESGSPKRIEFQVHGMNSPPRKFPFLPKSRISHTVSVPAQDPIQREIQRNYKEFLGNKVNDAILNQQGELGGVEDEAEEESKAFESAFLEDSQTEGWTTETSVSSLELGV